MNNITGEFKKEIMDSIKSLHEKRDADAVKITTIQITVDGINRRLDLLNGSVAKHADKLMEVEKADIRNIALLEESKNEVKNLKARIDADGRVIIDLQDKVQDFPLVRKVVYGFITIILISVLGWLLVFTPFSKR